MSETNIRNSTPENGTKGSGQAGCTRNGGYPEQFCAGINGSFDKYASYKERGYPCPHTGKDARAPSATHSLIACRMNQLVNKIAFKNLAATQELFDASMSETFAQHS